MHLIDDAQGQDIVSSYTQEAANKIYAERLEQCTNPENRAKAEQY